MLCELCGHNNPENNRFCGMCGMPLENAVFKSVGNRSVSREAGAKQAETAAETPLVQTDVAEPPQVSIPDEDPVFSKPPDFKRKPDFTASETRAGESAAQERPSSYTGTPSFLGLNDPCEESPYDVRRPSGIGGPSFLGLDRGESGSYLLEDEEPRSHWRAYALVLVILALALLVGLQWRTEVKDQAQRVAALVRARMNSTIPRSKTQEPVTSAENTSAPASANAPAMTAAPPAAVAGSRATPGASPAARPASDPADAAATAAPPADKATASTPGKDPGSPAPSSSEARTEPAAPEPAASKSVVEKTEETRSSRDPSRQAEGSKAAARNSKLTSRPPERADNALLLRAQSYLHAGHCQQGMIYLQQALRQPTADALSQMGALYATGTCVRQSRVEAYRWFNSALQMDPRNPWLSRERDMLYGEMTSNERRQVGP